MERSNYIESIYNMGPFIGIIIIIVLAFIVLSNTLFTVQTQTNVIIQRFGKFVKIAKPGLNVKIPFIDVKAGKVSLRLEQLDVEVETKTRDNVFTRLVVSVQYAVPDNVESVRNSFYKLSQPKHQVTAYVFDSVRAKVPNMDLDDVFAKKDDIANEVKSALLDEMGTFGYEIIRALVTDIIPDQRVKDSMNEINAQQRQKAAAEYEGQANRVRIVAKAEAEAESKKLQGEGIANQRKAIIDGLNASVSALQESGIDQTEVLNLILLTQYFDTLSNLGAAGATTILLPGSPNGLSTLGDEIRQALITGGVTVDSVNAEKTEK